MSGVVKATKKVFKKVVDVVKKIAKPLAIAAAVYFTGGLALSAFPATASFAASLPGFAGGGALGTGIGAGATAGTGIFSKAAAALGMGGGLAGGAASAGTSAAALTSTYGASTALAATGAAPASALATGAATTGALGGSAVGAGLAATGISFTEKLLLAQMGTKAIGAFMAPDLDEQYEERAKFRGSFYGASRSEAPDLAAAGVQQPREIMASEGSQPGQSLTQLPKVAQQGTMGPQGSTAAQQTLQAPRKELMASNEPQPIGPKDPLAEATQPSPPRKPGQARQNDPITMMRPDQEGVLYV